MSPAEQAAEIERLKEKECVLDRLAQENWATVLRERERAEAAEAKVAELEEHRNWMRPRWP